MPIPTNYSTLQTEIANWLKRDDLTGDIPSFINFGEARINRVSRLQNQNTTATVTTTIGQASSSLPSGFADIISLRYDDDSYEDPKKVDITKLDEEFFNTNGLPTHYAISGSNFYWNQPADNAYDLTCRYWKKWDIKTDDTNWLLTNYQDVYVYTALLEAGRYVGHKKTLLWEQAAQEALNQLEYESSKQSKANMRVDDGLVYRRGYGYNINTDY